MMAAAFFKVPEIALDPKEAQGLAEAIADVGQYYDTRLSGEAVAWVNLAVAAGMVYGTRAVVLFQQRKPKPKPAPQSPEEKAVTPPELPDAAVFAHASSAG